ncbi:hypothetical protein OYC64_010004 [Pagothenia borchgrevinki]|uniref:Uncharacterized protein n=1 Tax=Pagothenia borchgrevinki TaxID=8213 RepID=A0ABD2H6N1_PAGBO
MDEEVDPDNENVNSVLAQESSELLRIISGQTPAVIMKLCEMMPSEGTLGHGPGPRQLLCNTPHRSHVEVLY